MGGQFLADHHPGDSAGARTDADADAEEPGSGKAAALPPADRLLRNALGTKSLVMVGLPGVGKSSVGRRLANRLGVSFVDADTEIEKAAGMPITEIFAKHGEPAFREGEQRVIARLLDNGPQVLATGGGAYMAAETREAIARRGIAIWLDAATEVLVARIAKRTHRPMFIGVDPQAKVLELRALRDPMFAKADIHVRSSAGPHERVVRQILATIRDQFGAEPNNRNEAP